MSQPYSLPFFILTGDLNRDRQVTISDFITLASNFGKSNASYTDGDVNYDGEVSIADFIALAAKFNNSLPPPPPQAPPEAAAAKELAEPLSAQILQTDIGSQVLKTKPHRVHPKILARQRPHHRMKKLQQFR